VIEDSELVVYLLAVDPADADTVYAALVPPAGFYFAEIALFRSMNGGDTWERVGGGLPDVSLSALEFDPRAPGHLACGHRPPRHPRGRGVPFDRSRHLVAARQLGLDGDLCHLCRRGPNEADDPPRRHPR
jgi:hypothetical protein